MPLQNPGVVHKVVYAATNENAVEKIEVAEYIRVTTCSHAQDSIRNSEMRGCHGSGVDCCKIGVESSNARPSDPL
jgi:putative ubiquitin-RnfH superfamily antitoxin RatB of RatAB toxin-antitoxin module